MNLKVSLALTLWLISIVYCLFVPEQSEFLKLMIGLIPAFACYAYVVANSDELKFSYVIVVAILARIIVLWGFPNLSDDIYRFIWDGRLWHSGAHPFMMTPSAYLETHGDAWQPLHDLLNSPDYYSIYPPITQAIFYCSTALSNTIGGAATIMQIVHCCADLITLYLITLLLKDLGLPKSRIYLYALHPLIIIELILNLHHESLVICFLVATLLCIKREKMILGGLALGAAIATKILPVLFLPVLFFYLTGRKHWVFLFSVVLSTLAFFFPLLWEPEVVSNLMQSADLYMRKFEFNASIYYLYRSIGYMIYGFNLIHVFGPVLSLSTLIIIGCISLIPLKRNITFEHLVFLMLMTFMVYLFLSSTVHPWYVSTVIALCIFTKYRMPLIWGGLIFLTYVNYSSEHYYEHLWIVALEYLTIFAILAYELNSHRGMRLLRWRG